MVCFAAVAGDAACVYSDLPGDRVTVTARIVGDAILAWFTDPADAELYARITPVLEGGRRYDTARA